MGIPSIGGGQTLPTNADSHVDTATGTHPGPADIPDAPAAAEYLQPDAEVPDVDPSSVKAALAESAEREGGVVAAHIQKLQAYADLEEICIFIRAVNKFATSLIKSRYGTKDMSIKAKSSELPPFNGFIPLDQSLGKKGLDPEAVATYTAANKMAIRDRKAMAVKAELSIERIRYIQQETGCLDIPGNWLDDKRKKSGELIGRGFQTKDNPDGITFHFWGERHGDKNKIFRARKNIFGRLGKGKPIELMANRHGNPITADYDLALVAIHFQNLEANQLARNPVFAQAQRNRSNMLQKGEPPSLEEVKEKKSRTVRKVTPQERESAGTSRSLADFSGLMTSEKSDEEIYNEHLEKLTVKEPYEPAKADRRGWPSYTVTRFSRRKPPTKSFGNITPWLRRLIPKLNEVLGLAPSEAVFHHGEDSENSASQERDNYPMTAILSTNAAMGGPAIRIVHDHEEFMELVKQLKENHYHVPVNYTWFTDAEREQLKPSYVQRARDGIVRFVTSRPRRPRPNDAPVADQLDGTRSASERSVELLRTQESASEAEARDDHSSMLLSFPSESIPSDEEKTQKEQQKEENTPKAWGLAGRV